MHKLFDFLDEQLSELLPLLYLFGTAVGTAYFFVGAAFLNIGHTLQQDPFLVLVFITGVVIAVAVELHAYLQQRRARQAWQELQRTPTDAPNYTLVANASRTAHRWMIALMGFQMVSSIGFWLIATDMAGASLFLWGAVLLRGAIVPLLLYGTGYLSRMRQDAVGILGKRADKMLIKTMDTVGVQWDRRLGQAARAGTNLANVAIDLMNDAGETQAAARIATIERGLSAGEQAHGLGAGITAGYKRDLATGLYLPPTRKSSGAKAAAGSATRTASTATPDEPPEPTGGNGGILAFRKRRAAVKRTPEQRAFALLARDPEASLRDIMKAAGVGLPKARQLQAEWQNKHDTGASTTARANAE